MIGQLILSVMAPLPLQVAKKLEFSAASGAPGADALFLSVCCTASSLTKVDPTATLLPAFCFTFDMIENV
jgi:hypothetical protein